MNQEKINYVIDYVNSKKTKDGFEWYELKETIFWFLIDNFINADELLEILKVFKLKVSKDFYNLSIVKQKKYYSSYRYYISLDKKRVITKRIFCAAYYFDLIEASRKSYKHTQKLLDYIGQIDLVPLTFHTMRYIKVDNVWDYKMKKVLDEFRNSPALENYEIDSLYDLYMLVSNYKPGLKVSTILKNEIEKLLLEKTSFDLTSEKNTFFLDMERLVSWLYVKTNSITDKEITNLRKIGNTLKLKFLMLDTKILRHHEYMTIKGNGRSLLKKIDQEKYIKQNKQYYKTYKSIVKKYESMDLSKFNYNGYLALYYMSQGGKDYE